MSRVGEAGERLTPDPWQMRLQLFHVKQLRLHLKGGGRVRLKAAVTPARGAAGERDGGNEDEQGHPDQLDQEERVSG